MASLTQWAWVWVNSGSWRWTGRPGVLWFMGSQRVGHNWATELNKLLSKKNIIKEEAVLILYTTFSSAKYNSLINGEYIKFQVFFVDNKETSSIMLPNIRQNWNLLMEAILAKIHFLNLELQSIFPDSYFLKS